MMVAVLLGALTLGACVDDNESQSVTDVRNAKAEQLKAMAELHKAQAEAELISANAEKALKEAKAEWQKQQTEQSKAEFAIRIEQIKAEAEAAIAASRLQAAQDEQSLLNLADARVQELYEKYRNALGNMTYYQQRKIQLTTDIAKAEAELTPVQTLADNQVAYYQKLIDMEEYKITLYNTYKGADLVELKQAAEKAYQVYLAAGDAQTKASAANNEANNAYNAEAKRFNLWEEVTNPIKAVAAAKELRQNYGWMIITESEKYLSDSKSISYYTLNASSVEREKQNLEGRVKTYSDNLGTDKDDATKSTLYGQLAEATKQKADALKVDPDADVSYYESRIAQLTADITSEKENLEDAKAQLAKFNSLVASFAGDDLKAYDEAVAALTKLAEAYEKAHKAYLDAETACQKAQNEYFVANELVDQTDVEQLIAQCQNNIASHQQDQIFWKNNVISKEDAIAKYKFELETIEGQIAAQQAIIDSLKKQIDAAIAEQE